MAPGPLPAGRMPDSEHESGPWRIHELVSGFDLEDAWALPVFGTADEFPEFLELATGLDPSKSESRATRFLWELRDRLGRWFDLGRVKASGEEGESTGGRLPFEPIYRRENEAAAGISNRTVDGVVHFGWAQCGGGRYQAQMAVYVKPRGRFGQAYMAAIKPFRHRIVYPALMRQFGRAWDRRVPQER